jgi:hypothetical protein
LQLQKLDARTHSLTVLLEPGTTRDLPAQLLMPGPCDPSAPTRTMTITSLTQLESGLLDVYGVDRTKRPNRNAWKSLKVWHCHHQEKTSFANLGEIWFPPAKLG